MTYPLYNDLNSYLRTRFGCRVQKITIDAGLTCPNRDGTKGVGGCIYCNPRGSGSGASTTQTITQQILFGKEYLRKRYKAKKYIAYFQSFSNTYAPIEILKKLYKEALAVEDIIGLAIGTRPDCINDDTLNLLAELNTQTWISLEYGLQSIHDRTLKLINRGHTVKDFLTAVAQTRARGLDICVHVILGLPGETKDDMLATDRALSTLDIQAVKIHHLYVIQETPLHSMFNKGIYQCLTREKYVDILCEFLALLPPHIVIHRLTGDPHPNELVSPRWSLEKETTLRIIRETLQKRNLWQGKLYQSSE
jgi:uncharacterized protein